MLLAVIRPDSAFVSETNDRTTVCLFSPSPALVAFDKTSAGLPLTDGRYDSRTFNVLTHSECGRI